MAIKIIIEKELEEWWGVEDFRSDFDNEDDFHNALIKLVQEDIISLLDGATWIIKDDTEWL